MTLDLFPETMDRSRHGIVWWTGRYQCRNWHGFYQSREGGEGPWLFHVRGFSGGPAGYETTAWVLTVDQQTAPGAIPYRRQGFPHRLRQAIQSNPLVSLRRARPVADHGPGAGINGRKNSATG